MLRNWNRYGFNPNSCRRKSRIGLFGLIQIAINCDLLGTRIEPRKSTIRIKIGTYNVRLSFGVFLTITNSILIADTSSPAILSLKSLILIFKSANQITLKSQSESEIFQDLKISLTPKLNILKLHSELEMNSWCLIVLTSLSPWLYRVLFWMVKKFYYKYSNESNWQNETFLRFPGFALFALFNEFVCSFNLVTIEASKIGSPQFLANVQFYNFWRTVHIHSKLDLASFFMLPFLHHRTWIIFRFNF